MKTLLTKLSLLSLVLTMGLASCTEEGVTTTGNGVSELSANARSATQVNVRWKGGSATDTLVATANGVEASRSAAITTTVIDGVTYHSAVAGGLALGTNYVFTVRNADGTSSSNITWSPATRWPAVDATQLWSTADPSPNHPSGLIIDADGITAVSVNGARKAEVDVVLGWNDLTVKPNAPVAILSPGIDGSGIITTKRTYFGAPYNVAGGLDADYYDAPITTLIATSGASVIGGVDVTTRASGTTAFGTSLIIPFLTDDGHFGRIELVPSNTTTGQVYTTGADLIESVMVKVSYQTQANVGYVARGMSRVPGPRFNSADAKMKY